MASFQGPKRDFKNRNRNGHGPPERQAQLGSSSGFPASPRPARAALGRPSALHHAGPKQPVAAAARRSAAASALRSSDLRAGGAPPGPAAGSRPGPERARGAGPRGLGGRERGTRGEGRAAGPARRGTWAPALPPPGHFPFTPQGCRSARCPPGTAGRRRRGEAPRRAPAARQAGARGRARPRAGAAFPPPHTPAPPPPPTCCRRPLAPQTARPPPSGSRRIFVAKVAWLPRGGRRAVHRPGAAAAPSGRRAGRPSRRPRFFTCREFSRAHSLDRSLFPSRARFLSFLLFVPPCGRFFRSRRLHSPARALLPAGLRGAGRPAALPAPLHPRSGGGGGGGAQRSDSFQYGTGAGRMRPRPPTIRAPPGSPRPSRRTRGAPRPGLPELARLSSRTAGRLREARRLRTGVVGCPAPPAAPAPRARSPQLAADTPEAVAQGKRRRLRPPTALRPRAAWPRQGDAPPGTQRPSCPCSNPRGKGPRASPRVVDRGQETGWRPCVDFGGPSRGKRDAVVRT